ncbi:hydrogenase nickel incorporation protein HypB [Telluria beijingensis]|uniref:hydrogenase nickel incorporation protein HypB n=1 Tax=Telluria beijingensis TaxID=3068633 RepID=UPI0027960610|nr:hydrogenase nickel incorporation protein HypB [Massilia sp. REN29]
MRGLLCENDRAAGHNRRHFDLHQTLAINLMSSPGAGKTALLEASIEALSATFRIAVIVGDLETDNDARRIRAKGVPVVQITTGSACHLDAAMVHDAWHQLRNEPVDLLFIENVGNLVCPASFALGQHADVILLSVPEGDDKPAKYPVMFRCADLMLITKIDLLPYLADFVPERAQRYMNEIGNPAPTLATSSRDGTGMDEWFGWLRRLHAAQGHPAEVAT